MRILVSNDDGIYSPGIAALAEAATQFGEVRVVAPDVERSSSGLSITASAPLSYRATSIKNLTAFRVNGTPADSVALGTHMWGGVDIVLSGLNLGFNLGNSIWHSGTLAAAKQAVLLGMRGAALSIPAGADHDLESIKPWVHRVIQAFIAEPLLRLVNVNLPRSPRGMIWTRASIRQYDGRIVPMKDPQDRDVYWFTVKPLQGAEEGTDRWAVEQHWISLTPLRLDVTDDQLLQVVEERQPLDNMRVAKAPQPSSKQAAEAVHAEESEQRK